MAREFLVLVMAAALLSNALVVPVLGNPRHDCPPSGVSPPSHSGSGGYYGPTPVTPPSHDPSHGGGSYTPPSHGGGSYTPPSHGGGSYNPPSHGGSGSGTTPTTPSTPSHGGGYYSPPSTGGHSNPPSIPTPTTPTPYVPTPTPSVPTPYVPTPTPYVPTPSTPYVPTPYVPTPGTPYDPNSHPVTGTCDFWRNHPTLIWGVLGYWGTLGGIFGPACTSFFGNPTLPQALGSNRHDGYGALLRESAAAFLNSMANPRFPFSSQQVRDGFTAGLTSEKLAIDQAQRFRLANEGHFKN